jgi:hypothetical protein
MRICGLGRGFHDCNQPPVAEVPQPAGDGLALAGALNSSIRHGVRKSPRSANHSPIGKLTLMVHTFAV